MDNWTLSFEKFNSLRELRKAQDDWVLWWLDWLLLFLDSPFNAMEDAIEKLVLAYCARFFKEERTREKVNGKWVVSVTEGYRGQYAKSGGLSHADRLFKNVGKEVESGYGEALDAVLGGFQEGLAKMYALMCYETQYGNGRWEGVGDLGEEQLAAIADAKWFDGRRFSDRLWDDKAALERALRRVLVQGTNLGWNAERMVAEIGNALKRAKYVLMRLIRTEANRVQNQALIAAYKANGVERYEYVAIVDERTTETCLGLNGKVFKVSEAEAGVNLPPMHPNCVLGDSVVFAPDAEKLIRSDYSGNIIEITTANGRRLSVTPNHIVLTQRGWVRAKNLIKGDKVINYLGWGEIAESSPANNDCVPSIENLFASLAESNPMGSTVVPSSPEHLKGDAPENGKIHIVDVDGFLRNKVDSSLLKFISDCPLVVAGKDGKGPLPRERSVAEFLVCVGLAADGIMGGDSISSVFLGGSLGHHQLVGLRVPSDYNARLLKSSLNDTIANAEAFGDSIKAFSQFISFDDVVDIKVSYFSGHVYDVSSSSTLYICNGIITSNCRSSTIPWREGDLSVDRDLRRLTFEQWQREFLGEG